MTEIEQKQKDWENRTYNLYVQFGKFILIALTGLSLFILGLSLIRCI